jgi:hypothetical protein
MIDEEEKNEARIRRVKRSFSIGKASSARKEAGVALSTKKPFRLSKGNEEIVLRLTQMEMKKQSLLRDRHGNRCNVLEEPEAYSARENARARTHSTGFKTSRKLRLELPHNYYPGPGSYEIKRYLQDQESRSTRTGRFSQSDPL